MGGIGNQMFQYAAARRLAHINQTSLKLDISFLIDKTPRENFVYRNYELNNFNIQENFATPDEVAFFSGIQSGFSQNWNARIKTRCLFQKPTLIQEPHFHFFSELLNAPKNSYLIGYWQSEKYFEDIKPIIKTEFSFKKELDSKCRVLARKIQSVNSICMHVRRGDFVSNSTHGTMSVQYYQEGLKRLVEKISSPQVFIFSDDIPWCKQNLIFNIHTFFIEDNYGCNKIENHMNLMTLCKHFVLSNSAFGWWAAWLCSVPEKIIIAPILWFQDKQHNTCDVVPDSWIKI